MGELSSLGSTDGMNVVHRRSYAIRLFLLLLQLYSPPPPPTTTATRPTTPLKGPLEELIAAFVLRILQLLLRHVLIFVVGLQN